MRPLPKIQDFKFSDKNLFKQFSMVTRTYNSLPQPVQ